MTLAFFVSVSIFSAYLAEQATGKIRTQWYLLASASAGFATLVKGPIGFLIPLLVVTVFNLTEKNKGWAYRGYFSSGIS